MGDVNKSKIELLSPAGSVDTMSAVIAAGADAVYIGGPAFGARAYAQNPDMEGLIKAIDEAHIYGKSVHVTVNTLIKDAEMNALYEYVKALYEGGADAVLVQDLGALSFLRRQFPDLPIHISTQMSVSSLDGAKYFEQMGASRVVLARELSIDEIRKIKENTNIELEAFVHGALCVCYSGRCLLSSMIGGRSGNRGRCAQPCRLPYEGEYKLSPKDLCALEYVAAMADAGVTSFKIEGRMKKPVYAAGVTSIYRKYIDSYETGDKLSVDASDLKKLHLLFDRDGFTDGYLTGKYDDMFALKNERLMSGGTSDDVMTGLESEFVKPLPQIKIPVKGIFKKGEQSFLMSGDVESMGSFVEAAKSRPMEEKEIKDRLSKTGDTHFIFDPIDIDMDEDIFMPVSSVNALRRDFIAEYEKSITDKYKRISGEKKLFSSPIHYENIYGTQLEALVSTNDQLQAAMDAEGLNNIIVEWDLLVSHDDKAELIEEILKKGKRPFIAMPYIVREYASDEIESIIIEASSKGIPGFLVRDMGGAAFLDRIRHKNTGLADYSIYTMNKEAQSYVHDLCMYGDTVPVELNFKEIGARENPLSSLIVYGNYPLMITALPVGGDDDGVVDRKGNKFPIKHVSCKGADYSLVYNSVKCSLISEASAVRSLGLKAVRLCFTDESADETASIIEKAKLAIIDGNKDIEMPTGYTKGHFRRGVE